MSTSVIQIHTAGSNAYLIRGKSGNILVDTCRFKNPKIVLQRIKEAGLVPEDITLIVLTHVHYDHVKGAAYLKKICKAPLLAHSTEAGFLEKGITTLPAGANPFSQWLSNMGNRFFPSIGKFPKTSAEIAIDKEFDLAEYGVDGYLLPTPGHTEGSISVILKNGEAIVGDCCIYAIEKFVLPPFANDLPLLLKTWQKLLSLNCSIYWPGHGKPIPARLLANSIPLLEKRITKMNKS